MVTEDDLNLFLPNLLNPEEDINDVDLIKMFSSDMTEQGSGHQMDDKQLDHMLDANIDVDKQINADLMSEFDSELAQIDSKTIEDVFKGVMDHQHMTSPTNGMWHSFSVSISTLSQYKLRFNMYAYWYLIACCNHHIMLVFRSR